MKLPSGCFVVAFPPPFNDQGNLASDGEASFDPFGAGYDVSDAIQFFDAGGHWVPDPSYASAFAPGFWTQLPVDANNPNTWVLPASTPCGNEKEPACEPAARWYLPGSAWVPTVIGWYWILEADAPSATGSVSSTTAPMGMRDSSTSPIRSPSPAPCCCSGAA